MSHNRFNALDETTISETNIRDTLTRGYEQTDASSPGVSDVVYFETTLPVKGVAAWLSSVYSSRSWVGRAPGPRPRLFRSGEPCCGNGMYLRRRAGRPRFHRPHR